MKTPFDAGSTEHEKFKKAAWYTDYCLREYFRKAGKTKWYANTLFVLVADHGCYLPMQRDMNMPESKRITLFMTGGALHAKQRGRKVEKIVAQHDIVRTLLEALGADYSSFVSAETCSTMLRDLRFIATKTSVPSSPIKAYNNSISAILCLKATKV
jgi:phosphoglycerol transferase MdoB-like AlkP superfamily enzyme